MSKKLYLVETISIHRIRYVVEAECESAAVDEVVMNSNEVYNDEWQEFSQLHVDALVTSSRKISKKEYLKLFDKDNEYLKSWSDENKFALINKIDYNY